MKHLYFTAICLCLFAIKVSAQNNLESADDMSRIVLTPFLAENASYPPDMSNAVHNKLLQIVTSYGLGGSSYNERFVITANFTQYSKEITATAPPMIAIELSPSLYIGDIQNGTLYASCTLPSVKGVGNNETKAYMAAIKNLKTTSPDVVSMIELGKAKIIEYYNSQIDFMLTQADALAGQDNFDEAIALLMDVPDVCKEAYIKAMNKTSDIFLKKIDKEDAILLNQARLAWSADNSPEGAQVAVQYLSQMHPLSSSFHEAAKLSEEIAKRFSDLEKRQWALEQRSWDFKMQQYNDAKAIQNRKMNFEEKQYEDNLKFRDEHYKEIFLLERQSIKASKAIGIAKAKQNSVSQNLKDVIKKISWFK